MTKQTMTRQMMTRAALAALTLTTLIAAGCESDPGRQRTNKTISTLKDTRAEFVSGKADVNKAMMRLGALQAKPADLTPAFHDYKDSITAVRNRAAIVQKRVQDMRLNADTYSQGWSTSAQEISDPSLRDLSAAQNERAKARFQKIDADAQEVRDAYDPFITQLDDLEKYLSNLLTASSIDQAGPMFDSVRTRGNELTGKIDALIAEMDSTQDRMSPTTTPVK